jgi:hypothetical protein
VDIEGWRSLPRSSVVHVGGRTVDRLPVRGAFVAFLCVCTSVPALSWGQYRLDSITTFFYLTTPPPGAKTSNTKACVHHRIPHTTYASSLYAPSAFHDHLSIVQSLSRARIMVPSNVTSITGTSLRLVECSSRMRSNESRSRTCTRRAGHRPPFRRCTRRGERKAAPQWSRPGSR